MSIQIGNTANLNTYISNQQSSRERILLQSAVQSNLIHLVTNGIHKTYIVFENDYSDSNIYYVGKSNQAFVIANNSNNLVSIDNDSISLLPMVNIPTSTIQNLTSTTALFRNATITSNLYLINANSNDIVFAILNPNSNAPLLSTYSYGVVGIGTQLPLEALHVAKNIRSDTAVKTPNLNANNIYIANNSIPNITTNNNGDLVIKTSTTRMILDANVVEANIGYTSNLNFTNLVLTTGRLFASTFEIAPGLQPFDYVPYSININHRGKAEAIGVPSSNMVQMAIQYQTSNQGPYRTHYPFQIDSVGRIGLGTQIPLSSIDYYYNSNIDLNSNGILRIFGTNRGESLVIDPNFRIGIGSQQTLHNIGLYYTATPIYGQVSSNIPFAYTSNVITSNVATGNFAVASFNQPSMNYGSTFAISSNATTLAVGAPNSNQGTLYLYNWDGSNWTFNTQITPLELSSNAIYGTSVALSSNASTMVVGAPNSNVGSVYVYNITNNNVSQIAQLTDASLSGNIYFGSNVAISADGNTIAVSAHGSNQSQGGAYVYRWNPPNWNLDTVLSTRGESNLGLSMTLSQDGNTVILPNPSSNNSQGTVLTYKYFNNSWMANKLTETSNAPNNRFGSSLAISSNANVLAIGSPGSNLNQGSLYVYRWSSNNIAGWTWGTPSNLFITELGTAFGNPIAMSGDGNKMVVGAITSNQNQGTAFVYQWTGTQWIQQSKLAASDGRPQDNYAKSLTMSLDGNSIIISAPNKYIYPNSNQGASYLYSWDSTQWVEKKLVYPITSPNTLFGYNPIISEDGTTSVVGASNTIYIFNNASNITTGTTLTIVPSQFTSNNSFNITFQQTPVGSNAMLGLRQSGITSNIVPYLYLTSNDTQVAIIDSLGRLTIGSTPPYPSSYSPSYSLQTNNSIIAPTLMTSSIQALPGSSNIDLLNNTNLLNIQNLSANTSFTSNASFSNLSSSTAYIRNLFATNLDFDNVDVYNVLFENTLRSPTFVSTANYLNVAASNTIFNFTNNGAYTGVQGYLRLYAPNPTIPSTGANTSYLLGGTNARIVSATGTGHVSLRVNTTIPTSPILTYNYAVTEYGVSSDGGETYDSTTGYVGMRVNSSSREMHLGILSGTANTLLLGYDASRIYLGMTNNAISTATTVFENGNLMIGATAQQTVSGSTPRLYCNGIVYFGSATKSGLYVSTDFTNPRVAINYIPTISDTVFTMNGSSTFNGGQTTFNSNVVFNELATFNNYIYSVRNIIVTSDSNIKTDLQPITQPLEKVQQLSGYTYLRTDTHQRETGLIAQDVLKVLPEVVQSLPETQNLGIAYGNMMGLMVEAIKELTQKVEQLTSRVHRLETEIGL